MSTPASSSASQPRSPYLWWGLSAIFVVGIIITLVIVLVFGRNNQGVAGPLPTASAAPASASTAESTTPSNGCTLEAGNQTPPTSPPDTDWDVTYFEAAVPHSAIAGPAVTGGEKEAGSCFSQDPVGALFAASHVLVMGSQPDIDARLEVLDAWVLDGPGKDAFLSELSAPVGADVEYGQIAGFRFAQYTQDDVYVTLAQTLPGTEGLGRYTFHLVWTDGDWRLSGEDPYTGESGTTADLTEFVRWGLG